jgi:phosphoribosylamine---glycine ligase
MKILLVGNGGREHSLAEAFARSAHQPELYVFGTRINPGIKKLSAGYLLTDSLLSFDALLGYATEVKPDFVFVGPDNPIGDGAVDVLEKAGFRTVAPYKVCAQLESSKGFTRFLLDKYSIPGNIRHKEFKSLEGVEEWLDKLGDDYVVKADGLAYGKGVKVAGDHLQNHGEAIDFVQECLSNGHNQVVIEEKIVGVEFSFMEFSDGKVLKSMPLVQDYKRAYEKDNGPNTGGMGSFSAANHLLPFVTESERNQAHLINEKVVAAVLQETGKPFKGILYGGFMLTKNGVKLIEYNARFGDPEAMNVMPLLQSDFVDVCMAILDGQLDQLEVKFEKKATVCKYLVPKGYPENPQRGTELRVPASLELRGTSGEDKEGIELFYSSVSEEDGKILTTGSRSIGVVGIAETIEEAEELSVHGVNCVEGEYFFRHDIGTEGLIDSRIQIMKDIRG